MSLDVIIRHRIGEKVKLLVHGRETHVSQYLKKMSLF